MYTIVNGNGIQAPARAAQTAVINITIYDGVVSTWTIDVTSCCSRRGRHIADWQVLLFTTIGQELCANYMLRKSSLSAV